MTTIVANFAGFMARGYLAPRATVRQLLDEEHGFKVAMLFIALGYLLEAILVKLLVSNSASGDVPLISFHLLNGIARITPATFQTLRKPCASAIVLDRSQSTAPATNNIGIGFASLRSNGISGSCGGFLN